MLMAGLSVRLNLDDGAGVLDDTLIAGTVGGVVDLDDGAGVLEDTLIVGTAAGGKAFLGRSSTVVMVGTAGDVTALDNGRVPGAC
jgi:hypothetical protein